jgi:phage baseplate assembly protein V
MKTRVEDIIRIGQVTSVNSINNTCRVSFDDMQDDGTPLVSYDLQIIQHRTVDCKTYTMPEIGEHVICCFLPNGYQEGFVLGSYYTANNLPYYMEPDNLFGKQHLYRTQYKDGTIIEYDLTKNQARIWSDYYVDIEQCKEATVYATDSIKAKADGDVSVVAGGQMHVKSTGKLYIESDDSIELKAPRIDINYEEGGAPAYSGWNPPDELKPPVQR